MIYKQVKITETTIANGKIVHKGDLVKVNEEQYRKLLKTNKAFEFELTEGFIPKENASIGVSMEELIDGSTKKLSKRAK